jgi:hypothetical protein
MVENTRAHPRVKQETPSGRRERLSLGNLFIPEILPSRDRVPLFIHFHGGTWLPEVAARDNRMAIINVQLGAGSATYAKPFRDPERFGQLLAEAEQKSGLRFEPLGLTGWSAGYGAIREILRVPAYYERVRFVLLIDALHCGYVDGQPGPKESRLVATDLDVFLKLARDAVAGKKQMIVTHSEIFPGTFGSTTETSDYLLKELGLRRKAVLKWGPMHMQQLSEVKEGQFQVAGFAGNSAPDHVDQLHALSDFLKWFRSDDKAP